MPAPSTRTSLPACRSPGSAALAGVPSVGTVISARAALPECQATANRFIVADEEALPFGAAVFDLVVSALSLQFVNDLPGALASYQAARAPRTAPETTTPEATTPQAAAPETTTPEATAPEATVPEAAAAEPAAASSEPGVDQPTQPQQTQAQATAQEAYDLALLRFREGVGNYLEVLTAESQLLTQQGLDADLRARRLNLSINLVRALGGGYETQTVGQ